MEECWLASHFLQLYVDANSHIVQYLTQQNQQVSAAGTQKPVSGPEVVPDTIASYRFYANKISYFFLPLRSRSLHDYRRCNYYYRARLTRVNGVKQYRVMQQISIVAS